MAEFHPLILYDGHCNLCNGAVNFVIKRDRKNIFRFASIQSEVGIDILSGVHVLKQSVDSIVYLEDKKTYLRSTAVLQILKRLGRGWQLLYVFIIIPAIVRDPLYDLIARKRKSWFGSTDHCPILPDNRYYKLDCE
jgi:predicted DCC family thiol-disulfide oxidoreductase YuxK